MSGATLLVPRVLRQITSVMEEAQLCAALNHPNIVQYFGICVNPPEIMLVFEQCTPGNLWVYLSTVKDAVRDSQLSALVNISINVTFS